MTQQAADQNKSHELKPTYSRRPKVKHPKLCNLRIDAGYSEFVTRTGFRASTGRDHHITARIYLPSEWIGETILFIVENTGDRINSEPTAGTLATPAGKRTPATENALIIPEMCRQYRRRHTVTPFTPQNSHVEFLKKRVEQRILYAKGTNKKNRLIGIVSLPPEWIGKQIICIKSYADGELPDQARLDAFNRFQLMALGKMLRLPQKFEYLVLRDNGLI